MVHTCRKIFKLEIHVIFDEIDWNVLIIILSIFISSLQFPQIWLWSNTYTHYLSIIVTSFLWCLSQNISNWKLQNVYSNNEVLSRRMLWLSNKRIAKSISSIQTKPTVNIENYTDEGHAILYKQIGDMLAPQISLIWNSRNLSSLKICQICLMYSQLSSFGCISHCETIDFCTSRCFCTPVIHAGNYISSKKKSNSFHFMRQRHRLKIEYSFIFSFFDLYIS